MLAEEEESEYFTEELDLGAESDSETEATASPMTDSTMSIATPSSQRFWIEGASGSRRTRSLRSNSFAESRPAREFIDRDCLIWSVLFAIARYLIRLNSIEICSFENAVKPCRTLCCGGLFCMEHISDVGLD